MNDEIISIYERFNEGIFLEEKDIERPRQYAKEVASIRLKIIKERGQHNFGKVDRDYFLGTLGEFGIWNLLNDSGYKVLTPKSDLVSVNDRGSFRHDIKAKSHDGKVLRLTVKSHWENSIYGSGAVFNQSNWDGTKSKGHRDGFLDSVDSNDFCAICQVIEYDEDGKPPLNIIPIPPTKLRYRPTKYVEVIPMLIVRASKINANQELFYSLMELEYLRNSKTFLDGAKIQSSYIGYPVDRIFDIPPTPCFINKGGKLQRLEDYDY